MVQQHSDVDQSSAVIAELDHMIYCLKSSRNQNVWTEDFHDKDNIIDEVNRSTGSVGKHILVKLINDYTPASEPIN